VRRIAE
jgi:hypothetical protein